MEALHVIFGVVISIAAFQVAVALNRRVHSPLLNPLLVSVAFIIIFLVVFHIPLATYQEGAKVISGFLGPATAVLAYSIFRQITVLKKHFIPILAGCLAGSITSMISAWGLCELMGLSDSIAISTVAKSVTTPIAIGITSTLGGVQPVTVAAVIVSGIMGSMLAPTLTRLFRVKSPIAAGVAIGASSHAVGTVRAAQMGELEGAMSGLAISVSGLLTLVLALMIHTLG